MGFRPKGGTVFNFAVILFLIQYLIQFLNYYYNYYYFTTILIYNHNILALPANLFLSEKCHFFPKSCNASLLPSILPLYPRNILNVAPGTTKTIPAIMSYSKRMFTPLKHTWLLPAHRCAGWHQPHGGSSSSWRHCWVWRRGAAAPVCSPAPPPAAPSACHTPAAAQTDCCPAAL